jgi:carbon-monoxide dehydrogenase large subunit
MPISPFRPVLAKDRAVHIGQPVALVVAESAAAAQDAADLVNVDYEPLDAMVDVASASAGPAIWPEAPGNVALDWTSDAKGDKRAGLEEAFARATHVTRIEVVNQRIAAVSLEPRVATASYDAESGHYTLRCGTQGVAGVRGQVAACMRIEPTKLRVVTDDVGGGFGMKASTYPEYPALLAAAKLTGRSVHWVSTRGEAFLSDNQGRDSTWSVELALDADGRFLGLRVDGAANTGAFLTGVAVLIPTFHIAPLSAGLLRHPACGGGRESLPHEHRPDRSLPRRRAAGSELPAGAGGRCGGCRNGHRSGRAAAAQPHRGRSHAVPDRDRTGLRQRRFPGRV